MTPTAGPDQLRTSGTAKTGRSNPQQWSDATLRGLPVGIVALNTHGEIESINPAALEVFDLNRENIITCRDVDAGHETATVFLETIPEEEQSRWNSLINLVLSTQLPVSEARYYHRSKFLEKILSLMIAPLSSAAEGGPNGVVIAVEDVTEKVTTEQYVILSEKLVARGETAAMVAHELNNHLSVIANNAELLSMNAEKGHLDKVRFNCKSIIESVFKIKRFAEDLQDHGRPATEIISYDIRHLIDDLLFSLRQKPRFRSVHFTIDLPEQVPYVEMDVGQIQQVLMNLLDNASDALEERAAALSEQGRTFKRRIGITAEHDTERDFVTVRISDNGAGMTPEILGKIFTLHFTTKRGGRGLGLYNCRKIIKHHGGDLSAESTPNQGATIALSIPRLQTKPAADSRKK